MGPWWLFLITISFASGDLQSYIGYDPDDESVAFRNNKENYERGIQTNINYNLEDDFAPEKRGNREEDQGKRQQRFHSWGGKRYEQQGTKGDDNDVEQNIHDPGNDEESYFLPEHLSLNMLNFVNHDSTMIPLSKRTKKPAFSSWGGKRNLKAIKQDEKRSNYDSVFQPGLFKTRMAEQNRKRYPAFNSWAGKRNAAFNSWGGKRGAAFNSWGGKRDAAFNSGGGKIGWNEKGVLQMSGMEGKEALDHEEKRIFETNCILFQPMCTDMCVQFKNLKKERSLYNSGFHPGDLMMLFENKCQACHCSWNEHEINKQLISHLLGGKSFRDFNDLKRREQVFEQNKKLVLHLLYPKIDKSIPPVTGKNLYDEIDVNNHIFQSANPNNNNFQIRFLEPAVKMNDSKYDDESKLNEQHQVQYTVRKTLEDTLKDSSDEIIGTLEELERNRDINNNQKRTDFQGTDNPQRKKGLDNKYSTQSFDASLDKSEQNKEIPEEHQYFSSKTSTYHNANRESKDEITEDYINYPTGNRNEIYQNKNIKYLSNKPNHGLSNWEGKRSPTFHKWYENKVPAIRLSNGKRRPAFSSWGGKRSEQPNFQNDSEDCISSNEGKTCINIMENFMIEPGNNLSNEDHKLRQKRNIKLSNRNNSDSGTTYENTLNRDKRSNDNIIKNKDITRLVLQGGFAWPMMVKSFRKGVYFHAWGGKR